MIQEIGIGSIPGCVLQNSGIVSQAFTDRKINTLQSAFRFVKQLPYRRNGDKAAVCAVLTEGCGTCSTKHALLYRLAAEQCIRGMQLFIGVFKMTGDYAERLRPLLESNNLPYIPEAHCYLKYKSQAVDCTNAKSAAADFLPGLVTEIQITPEQTGDFKVEFHKKQMAACIRKIPAFGRLSVDTLWQIREECIRLLS